MFVGSVSVNSLLFLCICRWNIANQRLDLGCETQTTRLSTTWQIEAPDSIREVAGPTYVPKAPAHPLEAASIAGVPHLKPTGLNFHKL